MTKNKPISRLCGTFLDFNVSNSREEEIPWTLDGEFGGAHKEITVKDKKQAVQIKVDSEVAAGLSVDSEKVKK